MEAHPHPVLCAATGSGTARLAGPRSPGKPCEVHTVAQCRPLSIDRSSAAVELTAGCRSVANCTPGLASPLMSIAGLSRKASW